MTPRGCASTSAGEAKAHRTPDHPHRRRGGASRIDRIGLALALGLLLASGPVRAQGGDVSAEMVDELTARARTALPLARLEDGSNVPAETEAERARPLVPRALEVQTIERGILAGRMAACGLEWQAASFLPYMQALRRRYRGKPMAYLGLLHGLSQAMAMDLLAEEGGACTDAQRSRLTAEAASRPVHVP